MRALAVLMLLAACGGSDIGDCPTASESTQLEGRAVMQRSCATCHNAQQTGAGRAGAPFEVNFDTAAGVQAQRLNAWDEASSGSMPPVMTLNAADLEKLRVYLACGATQ